MPKIVDREAYRLELAVRAVDVFAEHGYNGLGMRGIAEALGISKSALYHYFPTKKDLFAASTEIITQDHTLYGTSADGPLPATSEQAVMGMLAVLDERFRGELVLLLDYTKDQTEQEIAADPLLKKADGKFLAELEKVVGQSNAQQAYALMMGGLMRRLFNGQATSLQEIADWILSLPEDE